MGARLAYGCAWYGKRNPKWPLLYQWPPDDLVTSLWRALQREADVAHQEIEAAKQTLAKYGISVPSPNSDPMTIHFRAAPHWSAK